MNHEPRPRQHKHDRQASDAFADLLALVDEQETARWRQEKDCENASLHFACDAITNGVSRALSRWGATVSAEDVTDLPDPRTELLGPDAREFLGTIVPVFVKSEFRRHIGCAVASGVGLVASCCLLVGALVLFLQGDMLSGIETLILSPVPFFLTRLLPSLLNRALGKPTEWVDVVVAATCAAEHADDETREHARALMREYVERSRA